MFLASCATPKAIDIVQANDEIMSCNQLQLAIETANLNEDLAVMMFFLVYSSCFN